MMGMPTRLPIVPVIEIPANKRPEKAFCTFEARKDRNVTVMLDPRTDSANPKATVARFGAAATMRVPNVQQKAPDAESARSLFALCQVWSIQEVASGKITKYRRDDMIARRENRSPACDMVS